MQKTVGESLYGPQKRPKLNLILNIVVFVFVLLLSIELVFNSFFTSIYVEGSSMMPTIVGADGRSVAGGDFIYVSGNIDPYYGDIVVLEKHDIDPFGREEVYNIVKRAIAFEGDTVKMDHGTLYLKKAGLGYFMRVEEDYVASERCDPDKPVNSFDEYTVGEGGIFLMGDNRNDSHDSRMDGEYPIANLVGVVPDWSMKHKKFITGFYTFFKYTLPESLGFKK